MEHQVPALQRLSQRIQYGAVIFGRLIKEEDAAVCTGCCTGARDSGTAADDGSSGGRMMRVLKWRTPQQLGQMSGCIAQGMNRRDLHGVVVRQVRQQTGQALRQHRLAGPGRPDKHYVVPAGGRNLHGSPGFVLASDVCHVGFAAITG
jgi:hypothetical protein